MDFICHDEDWLPVYGVPESVSFHPILIPVDSPTIANQGVTKDNARSRRNTEHDNST